MSGRILSLPEMRDIVVALRKGESLEAMAERFKFSRSGMGNIIEKHFGVNVKTIRAGVKISLVLRRAIDLHQIQQVSTDQLLYHYFTRNREGWLRLLFDDLTYEKGQLRDSLGQDVQVAVFLERCGPIESTHRLLVVRLDTWTAVRSGCMDSLGNLSEGLRKAVTKRVTFIPSEQHAGVTSLLGLV